MNHRATEREIWRSNLVGSHPSYSQSIQGKVSIRRLTTLHHPLGRIEVEAPQATNGCKSKIFQAFFSERFVVSLEYLKNACGYIHIDPFKGIQEAHVHQMVNVGSSLRHTHCMVSCFELTSAGIPFPFGRGMPADANSKQDTIQ